MAFCRRGLVIVIRFCLLVIMLIYLLKFLHVVIAISLLASAFFCLATSGSKNYLRNRLHKNMLWLALLAAMTGSLLVHPQKFTFHTHWILAAYLLVFIFSIGILFLIFLNKKQFWGKKKLESLVYFGLIILLILVVQDAVTKTTYFSLN